MKRIIPPIFMLLLVVVITLATPIDAQVKVDEWQPVEPMTTTTVLSTESLPEMSLEAEPETVEVDDGLLTSPSGLAAEGLHLRHNLIGLEQVFIDADGKYYNGETVEGVCVRYNGNPEWAEVVQQIMEEVRS